MCDADPDAVVLLLSVGGAPDGGAGIGAGDDGVEFVCIDEVVVGVAGVCDADAAPRAVGPFFMACVLRRGWEAMRQ
jgi:hypothetical protein